LIKLKYIKCYGIRVITNTKILGNASISLLLFEMLIITHLEVYLTLEKTPPMN